MKNVIVYYGQSIWDVALQYYGDLAMVWNLIDDNNFVNGLDTDLEGGQVLSIREGSEMISNNISEYFNKFPAIINNSDYEETGIIGVLQILLKQIGNEIQGGDGFILIDILGGKSPFQFIWKNQYTDQVVSTAQNLVAASSGTYSVTVIDADNNESLLSNLVISVSVDTNYLIDDFGNIVVDEFGNPILVN